MELDRIIERLNGMELTTEQANRLHRAVSTRARDFSRYPISVRQANALLDELSHCWITSDEVVDLLQDLGRWVKRVQIL